VRYWMLLDALGCRWSDLKRSKTDFLPTLNFRSGAMSLFFRIPVGYHSFAVISLGAELPGTPFHVLNI
jgi:hypothetical protein